jgi:23S rRNA (guanosine2251-2'-O)-methyltransferase
MIGGVHPVRALLDAARVTEIWIRDGVREARLQPLLTEALSQGVAIRDLSAQEFDRALSAEGINHQGILARARPREMEPENALPILLEGIERPLVLALDSVTDPHNLGACLRSAEAFGVSCVVVPKDNAASLNQTVRKTSSGASELIPVVRVTNLVRCLKGLQAMGFWVLGAAGDAAPSASDLAQNPALVLAMGSEGQGLRRLTREVCDGLVSIPMAGRMESLNVSVATGVLLFDVQTQRGALRAHPTHEERV